MTQKKQSAPPANILDPDKLWQQTVVKGLRSLYVVAVESRDALRAIELLLTEYLDQLAMSPPPHSPSGPSFGNKDR